MLIPDPGQPVRRGAPAGEFHSWVILPDTELEAAGAAIANVHRRGRVQSEVEARVVSRARD